MFCKFRYAAVLLPGMLAISAFATAAERETVNLSSETDRVSYMVGMDVGKGLKLIKNEIDMKVVKQALDAVMNGDSTALSLEEAAAIRQAFMKKLQEKGKAGSKE